MKTDNYKFTPHELRIGSLVNYTLLGLTKTIEIIATDFVRLEVDPKTFNEQHSPIPLTEEFLIRFGFEKKESSTCNAWHIGINPITHDWLFDLVWLIEPELINAPDLPFYRNGHHVIEYVHQLQGLFYELKREMLTLKDR